MISRKDFLTLVLPPLEAGESYCTVGIKESEDTKDVKQRFVGSIDEICAHADEFVASQHNAFFAMAKYGAEPRRTTKNAIALKSFYIDLDCGPGKPYADLIEGTTALKDFCLATKLPKPTVVKSGMGAHLYWACQEAIPREEWLPHAERLKELCTEHGFKVDPVVTGEAARILRIPETYHVKDPTNPILVEVLYAAPELTRAQVQELLPPSVDILNSANRPSFTRQLDPLTLSLMGNNQSRFKTILTKSLEGTGCAQIARAYIEQDALEEPLWRGALSIAERCVDRDKAIHVMSQKHPEYSPEITERKALETKGPYTCETFKKLNPATCEGCPHKFTSPIQLGKEIIHATEEDNKVLGVQKITDEVEEVREYVIPTYPFPYFRGKNGGVYYRTTNGDGDEVDELLFPHDFYVVQRITDPEQGDTLWFRFHTPMDGVREFLTPTSAIVSKEKFMAIVAAKGVVVHGKKQEVLTQYVSASMEALMKKERAQQAHRQFGWTENNTSIILGEREIRATDIVYSPPSAATLPNVPFFQAKGDFHTWKNIVNYYSTPGLEGRAFAFFLGFGTLLMRFTALDGYLLNMVHRVSGGGKTTILQAINSIYGRPKELLLAPKDTINARMQRLGVMQNFAVTMDEITNLEGQQMSQLIYDVTFGRGKNRMKQHENTERNNATKFQTGIISSSNRYVSDMLLSVKAFPDGEMKRILEIPIEPDPNNTDSTWSRSHFEPLMNNYGHAIEPFAQALIAQTPSVVDILNKTRDRVDAAAGIKQSERYWGLITSLAITGGLVSKKLNLHDIPVTPVFNFAMDLIAKGRERSKQYMFNVDEFLGLFLERRYNEILVINGNLDKRTKLETGPIKEPRGALSARYEPDTKMLYISSSAFTSEIQKNVLNFEEVIAPYKKSNALITHSGGVITRPKRLFAGTSASNNAASRCLWFDTTKLSSFNEALLMKNDADPDAPDPDPVG
jgi:hypothetical protein